MRKLVGLVVLSAAAVGLIVVAVGRLNDQSSAESRGRNERRTARPNILLIVTDDQRADTLWAMPQVRRRLGRHGIIFENGFVTNSLCCPSRATILTGQHSHTTGVWTNAAPDGGFEGFRDDSTVATWLDSAGYRTGYMGKYFNGYDEARYVPPGWDEWHAFASDAGNGGAFYSYDLSHNGRRVPYGSEPRDYSTDVLARKAVRFIRRSKEPFFLYFAPYAPHGKRPAPRHLEATAGIELKAPPGYNERNVNDKPAWVQRLGRIGRYQPQREGVGTLFAADEAVGDMLDALIEVGELHRTLVVFTSDNGRSWGEHRWRNKRDPYDPSIRVPYIVRYDRAVLGEIRDRNLVLNLDLAPTIADVAGVAAPDAEGRSLLPLLTSRSAPWRKDFLVEHLRWIEGIPSYCGVRSHRYLYVAYETGEEELYDLAVDPHELRNRAGDPVLASVITRQRARLRQLCDPPPPGYVFPEAIPGR
jgi:N-acetylglucosamine-6-sulfatase